MPPSTKRRIITSYEKLSDELMELFHETYPSGYSTAITPIQKPSGETIYTVRLETEDTSYLVKVSFRVDDYIEGYSEEEDNADEPAIEETTDALERARREYAEEATDDF